MKIVIGTVAGIAIIILAGFFLAKQSPSLINQSTKLTAVTSIYPLYFFASRVGGDRVEVVNITPAGAEPHDYEPTAQDIVRVERSDVLVINGSLEAWADNVRQNIDTEKTVTVIAGEGLMDRQMVEDGETITDPHVWLSPTLAKLIVGRIEAGFAQAAPADASYFAENARELNAELDELDVAYRSGLSSCAKNDIVTSHAAFGYLAAAYDLNQVPIAGVSPDAEPSVKELAALADFAKTNRVTVIFFESLVSPKLSETLASEVGAKTMVLDPIEGLANDDLAAGKDYFSQMRQNLANLEAALQCNQASP